jgi:hypothetical protein
MFGTSFSVMHSAAAVSGIFNVVKNRSQFAIRAGHACEAERDAVPTSAPP